MQYSGRGMEYFKCKFIATNSTIDKLSPLRQICLKQNTLPWITEEMLQSTICHIYIHDPSPQDHNGNKCFHFLVLSWYLMYLCILMLLFVFTLVYKNNQNTKTSFYEIVHA